MAYLLDTTEYSGNNKQCIVLTIPCVAGAIIVVINVRATSISNYYESNNVRFHLARLTPP